MGEIDSLMADVGRNYENIIVISSCDGIVQLGDLSAEDRWQFRLVHSGKAWPYTPAMCNNALCTMQNPAIALTLTFKLSQKANGEFTAA